MELENEIENQQPVQSASEGEPSAPDAGTETKVGTYKRRTWLVALIAVIVLGLDQLTKNMVLQSLALGQYWSVIPGRPDLITIVMTANTGTACGYFPQTNTLFSFAPLLIVAIVLYFYRQQPHPGWLLNIGTGLILGGAFGNLIDRLRLGFVVDFIQVSRWPVFNVSDAAVSTAVVLLLFWSLRDDAVLSNQAGGASHGLSWKLGIAFLGLLGILVVLATFVCVWLPQVIYR